SAAQFRYTQIQRLAATRAATKFEVGEATEKLAEAKEKLEKARLPVEDGKVAVSRSALAMLEKDFAIKRQELEVKRDNKQSELDSAQLELANLELDRKDSVVYAHTTGIVTVGEIRVGDILEPGKPVIAIAQQVGFRMDLAVSSEDVGLLREGMPVRVRLDAFDYQKYGTVAGTVFMISPDSHVKDGQRTAVFTVKVALESNEIGVGELRGQMKFGMTGQAEVLTGKESVLSLLVRRIRQTVSLG